MTMAQASYRVDGNPFTYSSPALPTILSCRSASNMDKGTYVH
jgi:hypothetical protein